MPYITSWEKEGIYCTHNGIVTHQEIFDFNNEFYGDSRSDSALYQIVDLLDIEGIEFDEVTMHQISYMDYASSKSINGLKVAFICKAPDVVEQLNSYIQNSIKLQTTWSFEIFDDIRSARDWVKNQFIFKCMNKQTNSNSLN